MKNKKSLILIIAIILALYDFVIAPLLPTDPQDNYASGTVVIAPVPDARPIAEGSTITLHYLDVGQANSTLIQCDGMNMLIDGGNVEDSSFLYSYLKNHNIGQLDYIIGTHAHEDHIGGLAGVLTYAWGGTVYCPVTSYDTKAFRSFAERAEADGAPLTIPEVGTTFDLGSAKVEILACNTDDDPNNSSIALRIVHGSTAFLFTGDGEHIVEKTILNSGAELKTTVYHVAHHGSNTSNSEAFLEELDPEYAVISVGEDNSYGHPHEEVMTILEEEQIVTYRTDLHGTILCTGDGTTVTFATEK